MNFPRNIPEEPDFDRLFPGNYQAIAGYLAGPNQQTLVVRAALHERYELMLQLPLTLDVNRKKVITTGRPSFSLSEVASVHVVPKERWYIEYAPESHRNFGTNEWSRIVASNGDLSVLGINPVTNRPIALFRDYWRSQEPARLE